MDLPGTQGALLRACWYGAAVLMAAFVLQSATGLAGEAVTGAFQDYVYNGLLLAGAGFCLWRAAAFREERAAWLVMGAGIVTWTGADVLWTAVYSDDASPPYPSMADALWLLYYPAACVTLLLLARSRVGTFRLNLLFDGLIAALAAAALGCAVLYGPVVHASAGELSPEVLTNLAYPVGDLLLLGLVVAILGLTGWRPGRGWILLGLGLALAALADGVYLLQTVEGTYTEGTLLETLWPASALLVGLSAWQPAMHAAAPTHQSLRMVLVPFASGLAGIGLLTYDHFARLNQGTLLLGSAALLLVVVRTALLFYENQRMISRIHDEARTDPLTGLRNRRSLMDDMAAQLALATLDEPRAIVLFDLDGFKEYNDAFGHPAGDGLLARLGLRLADVVQGHGRAYRLGGDEFCVLLRPGAGGVEPLALACVAALSEHGEGFDVTTSHGAVLAPAEVRTATEALQLADRRMYARKGSRRLSAGTQSRDVLLRTLSESRPDLHAHLRGTAELAAAVGRELGMRPDALDEVARAAELHDVGKMAIPDAILEKTGPLDDAEWSFMRRHTIIGERILLAAPALRSAARLVRASHERWDGRGYPDGLGGEDIPLGARVVAACDAYHAMTTERPHRPRRGSSEALAELYRCAGTQFDPEVVDAFARVLEREAAHAA
ncbi:MAG TPA: diguanylate cyclase [Thermoleophilaceae bacterium]|nr:diguanylate cyclase [Thermoleophilaceae bacterium]